MYVIIALFLVLPVFQAIIDKLKRFSIMCVTVMEEIDYATTHYERLRFNDDFKLSKLSEMFSSNSAIIFSISE